MLDNLEVKILTVSSKLLGIGGCIDKIFCKSCQAMEELPDNSVALTVTSPPYWNAIDYDRHAQNPGQNYRTRRYSVGYHDYRDYLGWLQQISGEIFRVTKPGGFMAMVIGTVLLDRKHYPVPFDVVSLLTGGQEVCQEEHYEHSRHGSERDRKAKPGTGADAEPQPVAYSKSGARADAEPQAGCNGKPNVLPNWEFHQDIIWHKVTGGVKRAGVFIQKPYPGYFYPNIMTEYILIFRKPGPQIYRGKGQVYREEAKVKVQRLFTNEIANTVWHIAPVPPRCLEHPCPFPEEIPYRLIQLYSYPNDLVLDPFCGSGQTLKVAGHLGRHYCGYDISREYVELARKRISEPLAVRQEQLIAVFEKSFIDE